MDSFTRAAAMAPGNRQSLKCADPRNSPSILNQDSIVKIEDFDGSVGGPIIKDKLWFLLSGRKQVTYTQAGTSVYPNGAPGIQDGWIWVGSLRLTWSPNTKNKFTVVDQRNWKTKLHEILDGHAGSGVGIPVNPATDSTRRDPVMYYIAQAKWTGNADSAVDSRSRLFDRQARLLRPLPNGRWPGAVYTRLV